MKSLTALVPFDVPQIFPLEYEHYDKHRARGAFEPLCALRRPPNSTAGNDRGSDQSIPSARTFGGDIASALPQRH